MDGEHPYIDLSGVREKSSSPDQPRPSADDAPSLSQPPPPRRSTTGSPRQSTSNGYSGETSTRPSFVVARRASASGPGAVVAVPGGVPLRRRDSIKHPYTLNPAQSSDEPAEALATTDTTTADAAANAYAEEPLFRATAHGRRHSAAVAVLHRDAANPSGLPVNTTVSASPDRPDGAAAPAPTTQEEVKRYVATVMADHAATLGVWEQRVTVAEVYRDKPLRTGGRPAPLRLQDRGFLERVLGSLATHLRRLADARSLLLQTRAQPPPTKAGGRGDLDAWGEYCSCYEQTLADLTSEATQMRKRVGRLLKEDEEGSSRSRRSRGRSVPQSDSGRASRARSRDSAQATPRGQRPAPSEGRGVDATPVHAGHDAPPADASPGTHPRAAVSDRNPYVPLLGGGAVQRGSQAIRPGHGSESAMRTSPPPESPRSWTRAGSAAHPRRGSIGSAASLTSSRSPQQARALHPDTVVRLDVPTASPNDQQSPYGRLMSPKRASSPLRDPTHAVLVVPPPADVVAEMNEEAELPVTARSSRASRGSRASRTSRAVSSTNPASEVPPQLRTYSSPRGSARSATPTAATPSVHPLRRRQLLEVIAHYEKNAGTLQRGDLHRARECFYELYGEQQGLRQYCLWIDDIALSALRVPQGSA